MAEKTINGATAESPKVKSNSSPPHSATEKKSDSEVKREEAPNTARPLAPPPRPSEAAPNQGGDYFSQTHDHAPAPPATHLLFEPNPFDASFSGQATAGGEAATPGGTKLPPVAALTSPASLLPGGGITPSFWATTNSLRSGPLSPAMLAGPAGDYFGDSHYRGPFGSGVTPNESSMRTGLTPGGGGSMFPSVSSPNTAALFNLVNGNSTPTAMDFHRTAMTAAALQKHGSTPSQPSITSQPQGPSNGTTNGNADTLTHQHPDPFGQGDANDAANGLFLLAQAQPSQRDGQSSNGYVMAQQQPVRSQQTNQPLENSPQLRARNPHGSISAVSQRGGSIASNAPSEESEQHQSRPNTRTRGKRGGAAQTNGRRKADEAPAKAQPSKKAKGNNGAVVSHMEPEPQSEDEQEHDMTKDEYNANGKKMTDDEKRKNFLERNRVAALKCRQRKKQWLANLQHKCELFSNENESLQSQLHQMRDELVHLKTLLLAHKDCSLTQQQGIHMESYIGAMPVPFDNGGPMPPAPNMYNNNNNNNPTANQMVQSQQPLMNGGEMDNRRYS